MGKEVIILRPEGINKGFVFLNPLDVDEKRPLIKKRIFNFGKSEAFIEEFN